MRSKTNNVARKRIALVLLLGGVVSAFVALVRRLDANYYAAADYIGGGPGIPDYSSSWGYLIVAVLLLIGAFLTYRSTRNGGLPKARRLMPGWYDDPDSPTRLRYWDGDQWTDKTADKG